MKNKIKLELSENKKYILLALFISVLTIIPQFIFSPSIKHSIFLTITLILLFFIPKFSKILFSIFIIFLNFSNILIGHIAMHWSYSRADIAPRIEAAILSPAYESIEYMNTYIDYKDILLGIYSLSILFLLYKFIIHFTHSFKVLKVISIGSFTAIIITVSLYENPIKKIEPFSIPDKCIKIIKNKEHGQISIQRKRYLKTIKQNIKKNKNTLYDKVIVVMGESANKHRMSIYGYDKNTTPFLSSIKKSDNLHIFNAIAPTNQTRYSVPILLTKANVSDFLDLYLNSTSIISDFKINGYKTYWISNQGRVGKYDSYMSSMADEADIQIFANLSYSKAKTDEVILDYLNEIERTQEKEMYLIHLIGSHGSYDKRYTQDISLFKNAKNISNKYDNTIYYTDYILSKIINKFKDEKLLLVYVSDHAEVVHEEKHGHGFLPPFKDEYDVPLVIYSNIKNDRLNELYKENKKGYFNTENLNYMIEYISAIENDNNISFSKKIFALDPDSFFNYDELKFYK